MKNMRHILNEGLDKLFETKEVIKESAPDAPLTEKQREIARELLRTMNSLIFQWGANIKEVEVALQDVIERYFPDHEWWEVCDIDIFTELLNNKDDIVDLRLVPVSIVKSIRPEFLEEEKVVEGEDYGDECEDGKCDEDIGDRVAEYQKWVDYDMKKYGKISGKTMGILKREGFTVVKDEYGDLEVIPEEKDHTSVEESQKGSTKLTEGRRYNKRTFRYDVGDNKYSFYCETEDTRYGFRHLCSMFLRGQEVGDSVKKYYNRTWEMFDYQSAMLSAVENSSVSEEDKKSLKAQINEGEGLREGCKGKKCGSKKLNETGEWEDDEEGIAWKQELSDKIKDVTGRRIKVSDIDGFDKYQGPYCYLGDYKFWLNDADEGGLAVEYDGNFYRVDTRDDWRSLKLGKLEPMTEAKKCNEATKEGNLTRKERIKFITRLTTELSKEPFNYDWDEANDIAIKRADALHPSWRVRWDNDLDKQIKQELEHTVTKDEFERGDIIREKKCNEEIDKKGEKDIIAWWEDVEKWNSENGSPFNVDNDKSDIEGMHSAMFDMLRELKDKAEDLYKRGRKIYNRYAFSKLSESKDEKCNEKKSIREKKSSDWVATVRGSKREFYLIKFVKSVTGVYCVITDEDGKVLAKGKVKDIKDIPSKNDHETVCDAALSIIYNTPLEDDGSLVRNLNRQGIYFRDTGKDPLENAWRNRPKGETSESLEDDGDIPDDEYYAELEAHIKRIPSYSDEDLKAEYEEFKDSTHEDDIRVETALRDEMVKRGFIGKTDEGYELLSGEKVLAFRDLKRAKEVASEMGLKEAEYGDYGNSLGDGYAYCYWNKSGDRNDTEEVIAYYKFDKNGKARPLTDEEAEAAQEKFELTFDDFDVDESCK